MTKSAKTHVELIVFLDVWLKIVHKPASAGILDLPACRARSPDHFYVCKVYRPFPAQYKEFWQKDRKSDAHKSKMGIAGKIKDSSVTLIAGYQSWMENQGFHGHFQ